VIVFDDLFEKHFSDLLALPEDILNDLTECLHLVRVHELLVSIKITSHSNKSLHDTGLDSQVSTLRVEAQGLHKLHYKTDQIGLDWDSLGQGVQEGPEKAIINELRNLLRQVIEEVGDKLDALQDNWIDRGSQKVLLGRRFIWLKDVPHHISL